VNNETGVVLVELANAMATRWWKKFEDTCNNLHRIPACDGMWRTDRQTDGQTFCDALCIRVAR